MSTNLTGSLICTREAIRVMKKQPRGGHIFNMDGAGSGGTSTPLTAVQVSDAHLTVISIITSYCIKSCVNFT